MNYKCYVSFVLLFITSQVFAGEWQSLFNGKNLDNWTPKIRYHDAGVNFADTFRVEDGMIKVRYDQYEKFNYQYGHLFFNQTFRHFHLVLDYRFHGELMADAPDFAEFNSGVMFYSQSPHSILKDQDWPIAVEMQFLAGLNDGNSRSTGNMCSPGTNVVFQQKTLTEHCLNSISKTFAQDEWVTAELIVNQGKVTHIINGAIVLEYEQPTISEQGVVKGASKAAWQKPPVLTEGYIAIQSEGHQIEFKNIRIKTL